jgi:hypothetical protein
MMQTKGKTLPAMLRNPTTDRKSLHLTINSNET